MAVGAEPTAPFDDLAVEGRPLRAVIAHPDPVRARALTAAATAPASLAAGPDTSGFASFTAVEVLAEVHDRRGAVTAVAAAIPDVAIVDVGAPARAGRETVAEIHRRFPAVAVVASVDRGSGPGDDPDLGLFAAVQLGASSAVTTDDHDRLGRVAAGSAIGESHLTPAVAAALLREVDRLAAHPESILAPPPELTDGEVVVLETLAGGRTMAAIADEVGVPLAMIAVRVGAAVTRLHRAYHDDRQFRTR